MKLKEHRLSSPTATAFVVVMCVAGAAACTPDEIQGCVGETDRLLRIPESGQNCVNGETAISWNQQGPPGPPGPPGGGLVTVDEKPDEVSTASNFPVGLGGPSVTVTVPPSGLVQVFALADMRVDQSGLFAHAAVASPGMELRELEGSTSSMSFVRVLPQGQWMLFEGTPGEDRTFSLQYWVQPHVPESSSSSAAASGTGIYRNRKLWAVPVL